MAEKNTDQIRNLYNRVVLSGKLAELKEVKEGLTKKGIPYISIKGVIQSSPDDPVYTNSFSFFAQAKNNKGEDVRAYNDAKKFVKDAVSMTKNPDNPTMVSLTGSLVPMNYVGADGNFHESFQFNMSRIDNFEEYKAQIDIEGFILALGPETRGEEERPTGRERLRIFSRTFSGEILDIKHIYIPKDIVGPFKANKYTKGTTATFFINLLKNSSEPPKEAGGIGTQRTTSGNSWLEWVLVGASPIAKGDKSISLDVVKAAMNEWEVSKQQIKDTGYLGKKDKSTSDNGLGTTRATSVTKDPETFEIVDLPDEEFPF